MLGFGTNSVTACVAMGIFFFFNYSDRKSYPVPLDKAPLARLENIEMYKIPFLIQVNPIFPGDRQRNQYKMVYAINGTWMT